MQILLVILLLAITLVSPAPVCKSAERASQPNSSPTEKQVPPGSPIAQLYDMLNDPAETTNLYRAQPEVAARLLAQLEADIARGRSTQGPEAKNDTDKIKLWKSGMKP